MHWNHRVLTRDHQEGVVYGVYEVFYDDEGSPTMCTEEPADATGESLEELGEYLKMMAESLNHPVLRYEDFG